MQRSRILVVEDDPLQQALVRRCCSEQDWELCFAGSGREATAQIELGLDRLDGLLLDLGLPDADGFELLQQVRRTDPALPVIMVTGAGDAESAVACMKAGAYDYITKPCSPEELVVRVQKALDQRGQLRRLSRFESEEHLAERMGPSRAVACLAQRVRQVAPTGMSVLIEGESGTGKELIARRIHALSPHACGSLVVLDCGAIPESLIESELFGFRRGAFTGADADRAGKFQAADGGTLFLDEIGNLPLVLQARLLRALQEREVTPLGAVQPVAVDIRVICATNSPLLAAVERGEFRLDLYHRLAEFPLRIPPLRERKDDLLYLATRFQREAAVELGQQVDGFGEQALGQLLERPWPGNARELRAAIRRATLVSEGRIEQLDPGALEPPSLTTGATRCAGGYVVQAQTVIPDAALVEGGLPFKPLMKRLGDQLERGLLASVLQHAGGNKSEVARILDLHYTTVHAKLKSHGL